MLRFTEIAIFIILAALLAVVALFVIEVKLSTGDREPRNHVYEVAEATKSLKYLHITKCGGTSIEELSKPAYKWGRFDTSIRDCASVIVAFGTSRLAAFPNNV
jgi:hypothetical protein